MSIEHERFQSHLLHCVCNAIQILTHKTKYNHLIFFKLVNKLVHCIVIRHRFEHLRILLFELFLMLIFLFNWFQQLISFLIKVVIQPFSANLSAKCCSFHSYLSLLAPISEHFYFILMKLFINRWFKFKLALNIFNIF